MTRAFWKETFWLLLWAHTFGPQRAFIMPHGYKDFERAMPACEDLVESADLGGHFLKKMGVFNPKLAAAGGKLIAGAYAAEPCCKALMLAKWAKLGINEIIVWIRRFGIKIPGYSEYESKLPDIDFSSPGSMASYLAEQAK